MLPFIVIINRPWLVAMVYFYNRIKILSFWGDMAVTKQENGKWLADFYLNGKRIKRLKDKKKDAEEYINQRKSLEPNSRTSIMENNFSSLSFSHIATRYINEHLSKTKAAGNKSYINKLIEKWGEHSLSNITPVDVRKWMAELFESNYAIATIQKYLVYFKRVFNYAVEMEVISTNPIGHISYKKQFKKKNRRNITLSTEEFLEFKELFKEQPWYVSSIVIMLWHTGMRVGEVLNLKWSCVKLSDGVITLDPDDVKEGKTRTIGLEDEILKILTSLKSKNDKLGAKSKNHVFGVTKEKPLTYLSLYNHYKSAIGGSKWCDINIHDLRHSYTKRKRQEGHGKDVIKVQQGHTTDTMYDYYNDVDQEEVSNMSGFNKDKLELIDEPVRALVETIKKEGIPLGTLNTLIRSKL
jgi:integrase